MNTKKNIHILPRHSQILRVSARFVGRFVVTSFFVVRGRPRAKSLPTVSGYGACTSVQRIIIRIFTVILNNIVHATICYHALNGFKNLLRERFGYDWGGEVLFQVHSYISCLSSVRKKSMSGGGLLVEVWICVGPSDWALKKRRPVLKDCIPSTKGILIPRNHRTILHKQWWTMVHVVNLGKRSSWTSLQLGRSAASSTFSLLSVRWRANINLWPVVFAVLQSTQKVWVLSLYKPVPSPVIFVGFYEAHYMNIDQISTDLTNISAPSFADLLTMARYLYTIQTCQSKRV